VFGSVLRQEMGIIMNSTAKSVLLWAFVLICLFLLWGVVQHKH